MHKEEEKKINIKLTLQKGQDWGKASLNYHQHKKCSWLLRKPKTETTQIAAYPYRGVLSGIKKE